MRITLWQKFNLESGLFEHNHIELCRSDRLIPEPISDFQKKLWKGATWRKYNAMLINDKVII